MKNTMIALVASLLFISSTNASAGVFFKNIKNNETIPQGKTIKFGVEGMKVMKAGKLVKGAGHHHLIISKKHFPKMKVIPSDANHIHFGKGQTETKLNLKPGQYFLTLQFADGAHQSYGIEWSNTISVVVK